MEQRSMTDYNYNADSWDEFMHDLKNKPVLPDWQGVCASEERDYEFSRSRSWEHCLELAEHGCPTTTEAVESASVKVTFEAGPTWEYAPVGAFPCIPGYAAGVPENMFVPQDDGASNAKPIVRIAVNVVCSAWVDAQDIINRGAAVIALIDKIQGAGQRVELVAFCHVEGHGKDRIIASVTVKRPEEPVDMDRIGFALAHPSMLRRAMFRVIECLCPYYLSGYGRCGHFDDVLKDSDMNIKAIGTDRVTYSNRDNAIAQVNQLWEKAALAA
jgi:hypothetical protein